MSRVTPPDLEMFLTGWLRAQLAGEGQNVRVTNKEEPDSLQLPLPKPVVVIRDDSGAKGDLVTFDRSVGVSVYAGESRQDTKPATDLARLVAGILSDWEIVNAPGSPIAAVTDDGWFGPYLVDEQLDCAKAYLTGEYVVVGSF
jgi:hypothetical protein